MVDKKHRMKLTKDETSRIINERKLYPDLIYEETIKK